MDILNLGEMPEEYEVEDDGSVLIPGLEPVAAEAGEFDENLAERLPAADLRRVAGELCDLVEKDKTSRKKRDEQYEEGLRRTGLGDDAPGGADFEGASRVVHPVLAEACVDFSARAIKELFPSQGPVKPFVAGEATPQKLDQATRKARFMNWQLTEQIEEYRAELEQLLTQLPMGGSQYQKFWYADRSKRPGCAFIPVDDILMPYAATSFYTSQRVTHREMITRQELRRRVESGLYVDIFAPTVGSTPELTASGEANNKIEGREDDGYNEDGLRAVLEIHTDLLLDDEMAGGAEAPYIITIDEDTQDVLAIYRNWEMGDQTFKKLDWFVEWKFIPWRGAYGIGLPHLIGGISAALTGALRALLDAAHINNAPSMLKLKGGRVIGQNKQVNITEITELEAPAGVDDIRKIAMPMPFNQPSPVLMQLLGELYGLAKGVVATADEKLSQVGDRTPVGTTMSLIEQGSTIYSAIHARLHESQKRALQILQRLDRMYLPEMDLRGFDANSINPDDFNMTPDVVPVSDPTIFSEAQRFAQVQALVQMSADPSVPWNKLALYKRVLKQMRIEAAEEILPNPPQPVTADPLSENVAATQQGMMLKAAPEQDHETHIRSHLVGISAPWVLQNEMVPVQAIQAVLAHINEHVQMLVTNNTVAASQQIMQQAMATGMMLTPEQATAQAQVIINQRMSEMLAPLFQQIAQINEVVKQRTPPPPLPPEVQAQVQIAQMEVERKRQNDQAVIANKQAENQASLETDAATLQLKAADQQYRQMLDAQRVEIDRERMQLQEVINKMRVDNEMAIEQLRQQVELQKNQLDNAQKQQTELMKNDDDNETALEINKARDEAATERAILVEQMRQGFDIAKGELDEIRKDV